MMSIVLTSTLLYGLKKGFTAIAEKEGPFLVQCTEGKDRTGYFCMLSEALCDASYEEIVDDYMTTYQNYYHLEKDRQRYYFKSKR